MDVWKRIDKWLATNAPTTLRDLQGPATEQDVVDLEEFLGETLPKEMVDAYAHHNGQAGMSPLVGDWELLSLDAIANQWTIQKKLLDKGTFKAVVTPKGPVRAVGWSARWLPFSYNGRGDLMCVDLDPDDGGNVGQIIVYRHDCGEREVVARSMAAWLERLADDLEGGRSPLAP